MGTKRRKKRQVFHVSVKYPHTGWRLASQVYTKKAAEKDVAKWQKFTDIKVRFQKVKRRRTHGLVRITRGGRVLGTT